MSIDNNIISEEDRKFFTEKGIPLTESLRKIYTQAALAARRKVPVHILLLGDRGTGKYICAVFIHYVREKYIGGELIFRRKNMAAISDDDKAISELFGHERGAFTGAIKERKGLFEIVGNGTVFLDEIGKTPLRVQGMLLTVLEDREFFRMGENESGDPHKLKAQIVTAAREDLLVMAEQDKFLIDLYDRLSKFELTLPLLKERKQDIPFYIRYFLEKYNKEESKQIKFNEEDLDKLALYDWPGNIRELEDAVHKAHILSNGEYLNFSEFFAKIEEETEKNKPNSNKGKGRSRKPSDQQLLSDLNTINQKDIANKYGVTSRTIRYWMKNYHIVGSKGGPYHIENTASTNTHK